MKTAFLIRRGIPLTVLTGFLVLGAGCKNQPTPTAQEATPAAAQPAPPRQATIRLAATFRPKSGPSPR